MGLAQQEVFGMALASVAISSAARCCDRLLLTSRRQDAEDASSDTSKLWPSGAGCVLARFGHSSSHPVYIAHPSAEGLCGGLRLAYSCGLWMLSQADAENCSAAAAWPQYKSCPERLSDGFWSADTYKHLPNQVPFLAQLNSVNVPSATGFPEWRVALSPWSEGDEYARCLPDRDLLVACCGAWRSDPESHIPGCWKEGCAPQCPKPVRGVLVSEFTCDMQVKAFAVDATYTSLEEPLGDRALLHDFMWQALAARPQTSRSFRLCARRPREAQICTSTLFFLDPAGPWLKFMFRCSVPLQLEAPQLIVVKRGTDSWEALCDRMCWIEAARPPVGMGKPSLEEFLEAFWSCRGSDAELKPRIDAEVGEWKHPKNRTRNLKARPSDVKGRSPLLDCFPAERIRLTSLEPPQNGSIFRQSEVSRGSGSQLAQLGQMMQAACCTHVKFIIGVPEEWTRRLGCWSFNRGFTPFSCCTVPGNIWPPGHSRRTSLATRALATMQVWPWSSLKCNVTKVQKIPRLAICIAGAARTFAQGFVHHSLFEYFVKSLGGHGLRIDQTLHGDVFFHLKIMASMRPQDCPKDMSRKVCQFTPAGLNFSGAEEEVKIAATMFSPVRLEISHEVPVSEATMHEYIGDQSCWERADQEWGLHGWVNNFKTYARCGDMIQEAEEEAGGLRYDWVSLTRPDLLIALPAKPICAYNIDTIYRTVDWIHLIPRDIATSYLFSPLGKLRDCRRGLPCCNAYGIAEDIIWSGGGSSKFEVNSFHVSVIREHMVLVDDHERILIE